jgi:pilus assembly protein Flp/PilA
MTVARAAAGATSNATAVEARSWRRLGYRTSHVLHGRSRFANARATAWFLHCIFARSMLRLSIATRHGLDDAQPDRQVLPIAARCATGSTRGAAGACVGQRTCGARFQVTQSSLRPPRMPPSAGRKRTRSHCTGSAPARRSAVRLDDDMLLMMKFLRDESGATAIEYALVAVGISVAINATVGILSGEVTSPLSSLAKR